MKMANIPCDSQLFYPEDRATGYKSRYPVVRVGNVTVLPGVPKLAEKAVTLLDEQIFGCHRQLVVEEVYMSADEVTIAKGLTETAEKFPEVSIGSYPDLYHSYYKTRLTFESKEKEDIEAAKSYLFTKIDPSFALLDYVTDSVADSWNRLQ